MSIQNNYYGYVYKITCLINKRCYVGQKRKPIFDNTYWGSSKNKDYWNDLKQYGYKNFERKVLYWAITQQELNQKETEYIISEKALFTEGGYNLWLNRQQTELTNEIVEKHHRNLLKAMSLPEYKEKMKKVAESRKGKTRSKEICKKLSESLKNSAKHKAAMSSVEYKQKNVKYN